MGSSVVFVGEIVSGKIIICDGTLGIFIKESQSKAVARKCICPVVKTGPLAYGDAIPDDPAGESEKMNAEFRDYKYPLTYACSTGKTLNPDDYAEKKP